MLEMKPHPDISVIIPTFNRETTIKRAIDSVLNQIDVCVEVIVVDDNSTDATEEILTEYANVRYVKLDKNRGACHARNIGISLAQSKFIAFLDSDDYWKENKLKLQLELMEETHADICFCASAFISIKKKSIIKPDLDFDIEHLHKKLLKSNMITTGALLVNRKTVGEDLLFDEHMKRYQDWELLIRLSKKYKFCFLREALLVQEQQPNSITLSAGNTKTEESLLYLLEKNLDDYHLNRDAYQQIAWLIGFNSMYTRFPDKTMLWNGCVYNNIKIKRILIFMLFKLRQKKLIYHVYKTIA